MRSPCMHTPQSPGLVSAAGAVWGRSSFHRSWAGNREQLACVHALIDAQLAPVPQHANSYPGDVAWIVQPGVRTTLILKTQLLQHGAQLCLCAGDLEKNSWLVVCWWFCLMGLKPAFSHKTGKWSEVWGSYNLDQIKMFHKNFCMINFWVNLKQE